MKKLLYLLPLLALLAVSCKTTNLTRGTQYPKMYEEKPATILVMPPINNTTNVEAKDLLYSSISMPLVEAGYYVLSPYLALEMLKAESAYDAELFVDKDISMFGRVLGAEAVIFTEINEWKKNGMGIETKIHYTVRSTKSNEVLFDKDCDLYLDLSVRNGKGNTSLLATLIKTAVTDHIEAARKCNRFVISDLPRGKYAPDYQNDKDASATPDAIKAVVR